MYIISHDQYCYHFLVDFQLTLKRSNTLELEDVQEDVCEDVNMGKIRICLPVNNRVLVSLVLKELDKYIYIYLFFQ